jgi:O-methyltransferase
VGSTSVRTLRREGQADVGGDTIPYRTAEQLYLDLLKKALSFSLWPEPPMPIATFNDGRPAWKRVLITILSRLAATAGTDIVRAARATAAERDEGRSWPSCAYTMIGRRRLDNLQSCIESVLRDRVPGDLIETGVWRGGACIFMRGVLRAHGVTDRRVYVADSFQGLPAPDPAKYPHDTGDTHHVHRFLAVSEEQVRSNFERYGLLDDQVVFLNGWFKDTLPNADIGALSILRLDGDMYESTWDALNALYPRLSPGGYCIIDDYALPNCRKAVDDYREAHGIAAPMTAIDWTSCYWRRDPFPPTAAIHA